MSQDKYKDVFMNSVQSWQKKMGDNEDGSKYGFADVEGLDLKPYGAPYPA